MVFVVAEIGVNWDGDFKLVREMMSRSKEAGCNAVKFQAFESSVVANHPQAFRLVKSSVSEQNVAKIDAIAQSVGIEWFCTPMYIGAVKILDPYVKRFKIRAADGMQLLQNKTTPLFERLLETNKEIIISCQASPRDTKFYNHNRIKWLYCVPKYPCNFSDLDFRQIKDFHGYSNHCPNILAPLAAVILGASIVEVHITSNKSKEFVDNNVSFDYKELADLVRLVRLTEEIKR